MKFQKTFLAATLAVVGFSVQAAETTGKANIFEYKVDANAAESVYKVEVISGNQTLVKSGWYTKTSAGALEAISAADAANYTVLQSGGQFDIESSENVTVTVDETIGNTSGSGTNVNQNNYWSFEDATTKTITTTTTGDNSYKLVGQLVNYDENGNWTPPADGVFAQEAVVLPPSVVAETTAATVKKDVQIGNLTEEQTTANAQYDFDLKASTSNVQGLVATIKTSDKPNTAVTGVTGNGLAVLDVPAGGLVDLENGTVTFITDPVAEVKTPRTELLSFKSADGKNVVKYNDKYYTLDVAAKTLTTYTGTIDGLTLIGAGTAEETTGGERKVSVNTGLVSNKNVTYGESVTKSSNEGRVQVGSTDSVNANEISGTDYIVNESAQTVTSKNVVTGIIAQDEAGNKTYGLQATTVVDNKVTGQTTITAEGITTTGDISFVDAEGKTTTVKGYLADATQAVEAKFDLRANQLNSRINDVEKTAYRGVAIALAAQQQVPNIKPGQYAVFGGVGHYEGESAVAFGVVGAVNERTSLSAALGTAGSEVGGRVGVAYVFGGK